MRKAMLGALTGAGLVMAAVGLLAPQDKLHAQSQGLTDQAGDFRSGGSRQLIALPGPTDEDGQLFLVVDPQVRAVSVYHVDGANGKIALKSVRNIHYDLQMMNLNTEDPLPQNIRSLLEQRQLR